MPILRASKRLLRPQQRNRTAARQAGLSSRRSRAPSTAPHSPGAPPFVEVGAAVKEGDVVGILEIMKLMNHVTAPCAGVIAEIRANNEQFVEFGQVLALIDPERAA